MKNKKEYVYKIQESYKGVRHYQVTSNVKLTDDEVKSVYDDFNTKARYSHNNLTQNIKWSDKRFTDDELLNKIEVYSDCLGEENEKLNLDKINGEFEND